MNLAAIGADRALAEQRVVCWHLLHFGNDNLAIRGALKFGDRLQVLRDRRVNAGVNHSREFAGMLGLPALSPRAVSIIHVPIPGFGQHEALRYLQTKSIDVADEHQQPSKMLAACRDAELRALLDRIDGVAAGIGEADNLRLRLLRLQQE